MSPLTEWQNFYVVVGSAAGGLTGLQFVVMALIADMPLQSDEHNTARAFATPTIVHFVTVLMLAASMVIPWHGLVPASVVWALAGLGGIVYVLIITWRMRLQTAYKPVLEDWLFHAILPCLSYAGLLASAIVVPAHTRGALFGIAGSSLLLLFVAIHNAWDNVTYLVFMKRQNAK